MNDQLLEQPITAEHLVRMPGPTPWEILWQRKAYVALGAFIGVVLGVLYWSMAPRVYESTAQIWVLKRQPDVPITGDAPLVAAQANAAEDFLSTHRTLLKSAVVVGAAVEKGQLNHRPTFRTSLRPAYDLARALTVNRDRDKSTGGNSNSQVLNISFQCGHPDDCAPVLSAVIESYQSYLDNHTQGSAKQTLDLIDKARKVLQEDLEEKEKARDAFISKSPVVWKTGLGTTLEQERLATLDSQRTSLHMHIERIRATLNTVEDAKKQGKGPAYILDLVSNASSSQSTMVGGMPPMGGMGALRSMMGSAPMEGAGGASPFGVSNTLEKELITLQLEEARLLDSDYGPEHPRVKSLQDRMQTIRTLIAPTATPEAKTAEQRDRDTRAMEHLIAVRLTQLKQDLSESERGLKSLDSLYQVELKEAKKALPILNRAEAFSRAISRSELLFDTVNQHLREANVVSGSQGYETQVISPPADAEKVSPRGSLVLPLSLFLGLLLGCGLAYLAEITDKSFRSPEEIRRRLGLPIMGIIPMVKINGKDGVPQSRGEREPALSLFSWHRAKSKEAEAYRGVRTALYFSTHGQGRKLIQVTSPNKGDGKSTLAANLAISIAQSGKSVLLVDADLRRPQVAKLFGIDHPTGFSSVLGGLAEPNETICPTVIPGLSVIPAGPTPPNPAELLTGLRLRPVLESLRERFDYVIVDSPPLLAVTDPGVVGPQVDGVILTLRSTKNARVEAKRAKEILDNLGINIFGVVVNALDDSKKQDEYGYYGYYRYYDYHESDSTEEGEGQHGHSKRSQEAKVTHEGNGSPVPNA